MGIHSEQCSEVLSFVAGKGSGYPTMWTLWVGRDKICLPYLSETRSDGIKTFKAVVLNLLRTVAQFRVLPLLGSENPLEIRRLELTSGGGTIGGMCRVAINFNLIHR